MFRRIEATISSVRRSYAVETQMTKLLLIAGFILALTTLGFAAANASPSAPATMVVNGQTVDVDYN